MVERRSYIVEEGKLVETRVAVEAETPEERAAREDLGAKASSVMRGSAYRKFTEMMERRMDRFTNDVVAALAASRTTFEHGVLTIRKPGEPDVKIDLNGLGLRIAQVYPDAGVAHNEAVLKMLRDLEPEPATRKVPEDVHLEDDPFGGRDAFLTALQKRFPPPGAEVVPDERSMRVTYAGSIAEEVHSVDETIGSLKGSLAGALSTWEHSDRDANLQAKADRYVLRAGPRFREMVLAHPDVAKAPYGRVAFNAAANTFTILGDVDVVGDESFPPTEARMVAVVDGVEQDWGFRLFADEPRAPIKDDSHRRETDPAVDRAIHTRDWSR